MWVIASFVYCVRTNTGPQFGASLQVWPNNIRRATKTEASSPVSNVLGIESIIIIHIDIFEIYIIRKVTFVI